MSKKKFISALTSLALSLSAFAGTGAALPNTALNAAAASGNWKFDFGGGGTASGYTGVSASDTYNASRGYGFSGSVSNVTAGGSGALSDAVRFSGGSFSVDLPTGLYSVSVTLGNDSRTSIVMENMLQMINLTGNNAVETIQIPVTDGQLNIEAVDGRAGTAHSISAIEITQLSTSTEMAPTIWICGDSTVANYYNVDDTSQHGWGQFLGSYIDSSYWQIRNMAASGQYAKGFVDAGQFDAIEYYGKTGDIYIISIGINDTNYSNATEYTEVVTDMVKRAKKKGMTVLLVKQQGRRADLQRSPLLGGRWFGGQLDSIGAAESVQVLDLFTPWQNFGLSVGYDGMASYYAAGDDLHQSKLGAQKLAEIMSALYDFSGTSAAEMNENVYYSFKNVNSGLYMEVADASGSSGANVQQWGKTETAAHNAWKLKSAGNGYYYIYTALNDSLVLDVAGAKATNGQNISLYNFNGNDNQQFKFVRNSDGSYKITTKISSDKSAVEVESALTSAGANVQQWEINGATCQSWVAEAVTLPMNGRLVSGLVIEDTANASSWGIADNAKSGLLLFGDRDFTVDSLPEILAGSEQIVTACDSKNTDSDLAKFTAKSDVTLYIALDTRVENVPAWMSGFTNTGVTFSCNSADFAIYSKELAAGASFTLGANGQNYNCMNYGVFVAEAAQTTTVPVTTTTTQAQTSEIVMGDANCDGIVSVADAVAILQSIGNADKYALTPQGKINGDVDGVPGITANDALFLQRVDAGLEKLPEAPAVTTSTTTKATTTTTTDPRYFAVDQTWQDGVTETTNEGYSKTSSDMGITDNIGYVNLDNILGSNITFNVNMDASGNYMTHIRFANGSTSDRKMYIYVNGNTTEYWLQSFPATGAWSDWTEIGIVLPLKAGANTVKLESAVAEGGPNLDYLTFTLTDEPIAELYDPNQQQETVDNTKPAVYLAGDSTCQYYNASKQSQNGGPIQGWGYYLQNYFTDNVSVYNHAIAGRSSKKFYDEGRFAAITDSLKEGDFVMIQFAINDSGASNADRYAPTCGNVDNPTDGSYEWYMTSFIKDTLAKGATPVLMSCTLSAKSYSNGKFSASYTNYTDACRNLAKKYNVPFIDVNGAMVNHYNSVGYDKAVSYHMAAVVAGSTDMTHFNEGGADVIAGLIANEVKNANISGLSNYVK